jgi:hypothetical protein
VQDDVHDVVAELVAAEEPLLDPVARVRQRVVLAGRAGLEPDLAQPVVGAIPAGLDDEVDVVPDERAAQRRALYDAQREQHDGRRGEATP